jgi:hypothetical protein
MFPYRNLYRVHCKKHLLYIASISLHNSSISIFHVQNSCNCNIIIITVVKITGSAVACFVINVIIKLFIVCRPNVYTACHLNSNSHVGQCQIIVTFLEIDTLKEFEY